MKLPLALIIILVCSCRERQKQVVWATNVVDSAQVLLENNLRTDSIQPTDFFVDSLNIGRKSFNKIELSIYTTIDSIYAVIKFYSKHHNQWILKNDFRFEKDGLLGLDTKLSDFNNDGLNDMTYVSGIAARGANEVRRLFIYDKRSDGLICMKNSEEYPNMLYNKELDCIDAFLVYGGCSTVFLKISGDSLVEFASVELMDGLTISTYDRFGQEKIIFEDTSNKAAYIRYKNYKPLKEYED